MIGCCREFGRVSVGAAAVVAALFAVLPVSGAATERARCSFAPLCPPGMFCVTVQRVLTFERSTAVDGLWALHIPGRTPDAGLAARFAPMMGEATVLVAEAAGGGHMFVIAADGDAIYTEVAGGVVQAWHGRCGSFS